nr:protein FAM3D isoform X2 [Pogona vitticeps]
MRVTGVLRILALLFTLVTTWFFASAYFNQTQTKSINLRSWLFSDSKVKPTNAPHLHNKCKNRRACPSNTFAFRLISGAANVVGPSMCFENTILMSGVKNNIGRGLNIALINDIKELLNFLKAITTGTLVLIASYDDPATKLNDEARKLLADLGSSYASKLSFRDNWIFIGGKGLKNKSPFEQYLKNDKETNKYDGWPEVLEMEGCIPRKVD